MNLPLVLNFLEDLKANNNREWFAEHKSTYESARKEFETLVEALITHFQAYDATLTGTQSKDCIFRIYKDVRFAKDKSPYKTHFAAVIDSGGRKSPKSGLYLQIAPQDSFIAFGVYAPESTNLKLVRHFIYDEIDTFQTILSAPEFKQYFGGLASNGDELKRVPRDFPSDWEHADLLKHKHYFCLHALSDQQVKAPTEQLLQHLSQAYQAGLPFNKFINSALNGD